jgi:hypothetical protein
MSKGSNRRPSQVSDEEFAERWDAIFGHDDSEEAGKTAAVCMICGGELDKDGNCKELIMQQSRSTGER